MSDVSYTNYQNIAEDLHITAWVRNPTVGPGAPNNALDQDVLQTALTTEEERLEESLGPYVDLSITLPEDGPVTEGPDPGGIELEVWMIALIAVGGAIILFVILWCIW